MSVGIQSDASRTGNAVAAAGIDVINISYVGILAEDIYHGVFFFFKFLVTKMTAKENCYSQPNCNVTFRLLRGMFRLKGVEIRYGGKYIKMSFLICRPHTLHQISLG